MRFRWFAPNSVVCCLLALVLPAASGALSLLWTAQTTTLSQCASGSGGSNTGLLVYLGLVVLSPVGISIQAWRWKTPSQIVIPLAFVAMVLGLTAVFLGAQIWWSAHNCMT